MAKEKIKGVDFIESKDSVNGVKDDQFIALRDELVQIRLSRGMYVGDGGNKGALHLFKEIFNNSLDEMNNAQNAYKKVKRIYVSFSEKAQKFTVMDEGRGIPMDILKDAVMTKHVTTKNLTLSESRNKKQTGLNGVGQTLVAALSDSMTVTTFRGTQMKRIRLLDGNLVEEVVKPLKKDEQTTGTMTEFIPSKKYLGDFHIDNDMISDFLRNMSYVVEPDVEISLTLEDAPKKHRLTIMKAQGLEAAVKYMSSDLEFPPVLVKVSTDAYDLSIAFSYDRKVNNTEFTSYCNYVITDFGGTHETVAQQAICQYFTREAKRLDPNSKQEISFEDCKNGLLITVNLEHIKPEFESQNKERVSNKFTPEDKKLISDAIYNVMNNNGAVLKKAITYLRNVSKARQEANKIKGVKLVKQTTFLDDAEIPKFFPTTDRNANHYKELYLCEGDSAAGGVDNCRNRKYQAIMTINGVVDNVHDCSLPQLLQKSTFKNLLNVLGCGVGPNFDINKLRYNKIIICTDKDIDGSNITSLLLCFFITFLPELIYQGKVYKAMPPLYLMDQSSLKKYYKGREWLYDKYEYYDLYHNIIADNVDLWIEETPADVLKSGKTPKLTTPYITKLTKKQMVQWMNMTSEYSAELNNLGKKAACNPTLLEIVCSLKKHFKNKKDFETAIHNNFPEMSYDINNESLMGSWDGDYFSLICDKLFDYSASRYLQQLARNENNIYVWFRSKKDPDGKPTRCTVGQFLDIMTSTINLKIEQRFKGVGEAEAQLLFKTTINPKLRKLYKITIEDIKEAKATFELLHGKSAELREKRRELLDSASLSYADIDN